jgi:hypothetical protein
MEFKYYHGTSTIFLDSIRKNGLGKINPNIDFKNLDVLNYLVKIAENNLIENSEYIEMRETTLAMANQTFLKFTDNFGNINSVNYRHDGIYVAMTRARAAMYAGSNKFGSEILERIIQLYELLIKENINFHLPKKLNLFEIEKYLNCRPEPIVIEVTEIDVEFLENEDGKSAKETLKFLRKIIPFMSEKEKFESLQFYNFKILKPIEPQYLKFYKLEFEGCPLGDNFEFTLGII